MRRAPLVERSQAHHQPPYAAAEEASPERPMLVSGCGLETDPSLVGQVGDPLRLQHCREQAKHTWQTLRRHHRHTIQEHLAPGHLGAMNGHDRPHHDVGVGQDLGGSVGLEVTARRVAARG